MHSVEEILPKCAGQNYVTCRRDTLCMTALKAFRFAVAASEIVTQSQVGMVGIKIVHSLNHCIKIRKWNRLLVTFVVFFTPLWAF